VDSDENIIKVDTRFFECHPIGEHRAACTVNVVQSASPIFSSSVNCNVQQVTCGLEVTKNQRIMMMMHDMVMDVTPGSTHCQLLLQKSNLHDILEQVAETKKKNNS